jgi:hypothetical protein
MLRMALIGVFAAGLIAPASATAVRWTLSKDPIELSGYEQNADEGDYVLRLTCTMPGTLEIGIGAHKDIGANKKRDFSATLASGPQSVTLSGKAADSKNVEMTGARELRLEQPLAAADKLLAVLATGSPIKASGAFSDTWTVRSLTQHVAAFKKACGS